MGSSNRGATTYWLDPRVQLAHLGREWALMFRPTTVLPDVLAGVSVSLVALPLSLAIANASGVDPAVGLVTAIVGGVIVPLFGGCRLQVSGPAAAMTFLVYELIERWDTIGREEGMPAHYGLMMVVAATALAGLMQITTGIFRIGRIMQFIPRPVVAGFLSGIGITILCTQFPKVLGYDVRHDEEGGAVGLLIETLRGIDRTSWPSVIVGLVSIGVMIGAPRLSRRIPAPLIAVVGASLLPVIAGWGPDRVALLGPLPDSLPSPSLPAIPWAHVNELFSAALTIFFLASVESLLSASVVGGMARDREQLVDHDQELVGQGLGNVASSLFAGLPVTGVIARSATNIQAGARTRLASIVHALILLLMMFSLGSLVARIPIAALAGVLIAVALRMIEWKLLRVLWYGARAESVVYLVTLGAIAVTDLIVGVPVGMIAALLYVIYELSKLEVRPVKLGDAGPAAGLEETAGCRVAVVVRVDGPLFFASVFHLRNVLGQLSAYRTIIFDMGGMPLLDFTGAEILEEAVDRLKASGCSVVFTRLSPAAEQRIRDFSSLEFEGLRSCPIYATLGEALEKAQVADTKLLCEPCRSGGQCRSLEQAMRLVESPTPAHASHSAAGSTRP